MVSQSSFELTMISAMLQEHNGENPILVDEVLLNNHESKIRVHQCKWSGCTMHVALEHKHVSKHLQLRHNVDTSATSEETQKISCLWDGCSPCQVKPGNMARHVLSTHLAVRWKCLTCTRSYTREDAFRRHTQETAQCQSASHEIEYGGAGVREIDIECIYGGWSSEQNVICLPHVIPVGQSLS